VEEQLLRTTPVLVSVETLVQLEKFATTVFVEMDRPSQPEQAKPVLQEFVEEQLLRRKRHKNRKKHLVI